jgi:hypothetical protein
MRMNRLGRFLRRLPVLLPLLAVACASANAGAGSGPSQERSLDLLAITLGSAAIVAVCVLMYIDNQD